MKIGFIGAGHVGFSMGKYLTMHDIAVTGYYSRTPESSKEAGRFTGTRQYLSQETLVRDSDAVFITVPDRAIADVWGQLCRFPLQDKLICHFSGAFSSGIFSNIAHTHAYGYSIHPLMAFPDRYESYKGLANAFFTIEGAPERLSDLKALFDALGNSYAVIDRNQKSRYHAAAAVASNLYVGLVYMAEQMLAGCGFTEQEAHAALKQLVLGNTENIVKLGPVQALTGPIDRNDIGTVRRHMEQMSPDEQNVYRSVSLKVLEAAKQKHPETDYNELEGVLRK